MNSKQKREVCERIIENDGCQGLLDLQCHNPCPLRLENGVCVGSESKERALALLDKLDSEWTELDPYNLPSDILKPGVYEFEYMENSHWNKTSSKPLVVLGFLSGNNALYRYRKAQPKALKIETELEKIRKEIKEAEMIASKVFLPVVEKMQEFVDYCKSLVLPEE